MKISLDENSLQKLDILNSNLEKLIVSVDENTRVNNETLEWLQALMEKNKKND